MKRALGRRTDRGSERAAAETGLDHRGGAAPRTAAPVDPPDLGTVAVVRPPPVLQRVVFQTSSGGWSTDQDPTRVFPTQLQAQDHEDALADVEWEPPAFQSLATKKKGKTKLPPRVDRKRLQSEFAGPNKKRVVSAAKKAKRTSRHARHESRLVADAKLRDPKLNTPEENHMAASGEGLKSSGASMNHLFGAETGLHMALGALGHKGGAPGTDRPGARKAIRDFALATTQDEEEASDIAREFSDEESDVDSQEMAEQASRLGSRLTDVRPNLRIGHGKRNSTQSNRPDPPTSSDRTGIASTDNARLRGVRGALSAVIGSDKFADDSVAVPMSPGGTHVISSVQHDEPSSDEESDASSHGEEEDEEDGEDGED